MRGYVLERDLRFLVNNSKYSDIEILCGDEKKLYGSRAILAARSEVFDGLLYNGMKESYEKQISFPTINSSVMEIVLEYIYTGSIKEEHLTKDNIIEIYYAADYFQLSKVQDIIKETVRNILENNYTTNYLPELLSKAMTMKPLSDDENLLDLLLVEAVAIMPLNNIEFGRLSVAGLQRILSHTHEKEEKKELFVTPEYEVFRYSAILAAKQVSYDTYETIMRRLPPLEKVINSKQAENEIITDHQKITIELEPLIKFIDFSKIDADILSDIIEPLNIIPAEIILNTYRQKARLNKKDVVGIQRMPCKVIDYIWDGSACGSELVIKDNGKVVSAQRRNCEDQGIKSKVIFEGEGIFEWNIIVEKDCFNIILIGLCAPENFDFETTDSQSVRSLGWVLGSDGNCYNSGRKTRYCSPFSSDAKITVHLNMNNNKRTCAFTVNDIKFPEVTCWNNLPSKLSPLVILSYPSQIRIQSHLRKYIPCWL